jgi:hypothetical protein
MTALLPASRIGADLRTLGELLEYRLAVFGMLREGGWAEYLQQETELHLPVGSTSLSMQLKWQLTYMLDDSSVSVTRFAHFTFASTGSTMPLPARTLSPFLLVTIHEPSRTVQVIRA